MSRWPVTLRTASKGFTLVETLVVAVIFSFVLAGIGLSFMSGMRIWQRCRNVSFPQANLLLTLEQLCSELRQSVDVAQIGFEGDFYKFSFPALKGSSVVKITYVFDRNRKVLLKEYVSLQDIIDKKEEEKVSERQLASLDDFSVAYLLYDKEAKTYSWENSWVKDNGVFAAVRLKAKLKDEEFTKTVFLPIY
jgi:prepilin-type N-terminal cleavage/methylation domain-containing protein